MNMEQMKEWIASDSLDQLESAWMEAMESGTPAEALMTVLAAVVAKGHLNLAETLGWTYLSDRIEKLSPAEALEIAKRVVLAVPHSEELRSQTADLYRKVHGQDPRFESLLKAAGLLSGQSPKRALRTLDVCLAIDKDSYLANRFDHRVFRAGRYSDAMTEFELFDASGKTQHMEPKLLADEFELVLPTDFRAMRAYHPQELAKRLDEDPAAVLVGLCQMHNGKIDSNTLKEQLVPKFLSADAWSGWWGRARTAAKRSGQLSLEGRNPITVSYHPQGRSLEDELAGVAAQARMPGEFLSVLMQYLREARQRKVEPSPSFTDPIVKCLAEQAVSFQANRPADALVASLALDKAVQAGMAAPKQAYPSAAEILAGTKHPAQIVARIEDPSLMAPAMEALRQRSDATEQFKSLLEIAPAGELDDVAAHLSALGRQDVISAAIAAASADPIGELEVFLWMWKGPSPAQEGVPGKVELLGKMLNAVQAMERDIESVEPARRKEVTQRIRAALSASDFASYRQAVSQMNEAVAATIKRGIERTDGLAQAVREEMLKALRESFFGLFLKAKVEPWLDESVLWTTLPSLDRKQLELKELTEIKMLENARAIGAAASHGDLSENSEWKFALEERNMLRARAAKMHDEIARARVLRPEDVPVDSVGVGSRVTLRKESDGSLTELSFLGPWDIDPAKNIYSYQTRIAQDMMGKRVGDSVVLKLEGDETPYRIEKLDCAVVNP